MDEKVTPPAGSPVMDALAAAGACITDVQDAPVFGMVDADLEAAVEQCQGLQARVFDATLALVREADERDLGRRLGASSTAAWLTGRFRIRPGQARTLVRLANRSRPEEGPVDYAANVRGADIGRELRETARALADGAISPEHVVVVGKIMERIPQAIPAAQAQQAEAELAGFCRQHDPGVVAKLGDYLLALMATDTLDDADNERERRRGLRLNEATGGISGCLTTEGMAILRTALDPLAAPSPAEDGTKDPRTPGQTPGRRTRRTRPPRHRRRHLRDQPRHLPPRAGHHRPGRAHRRPPMLHPRRRQRQRYQWHDVSHQGSRRYEWRRCEHGVWCHGGR